MNKKQWEKHCLDYIKKHGGVYDIFWATSNKFISNAMDRLIKSKKIKIRKLQFPHCRALKEGVAK